MSFQLKGDVLKKYRMSGIIAVNRFFLKFSIIFIFIVLFSTAGLLTAQGGTVPGAAGGQITPSQVLGIPSGEAVAPLPPGVTLSSEVPPEVKPEVKLSPEKGLPEVEAQLTEERLEEEEESEIERLLSGKIPPEVSTKLKQFGYNLFRRKISTFAPVTDVPVGSDYVIGPGDTFSITVWGKAEADYTVAVDRDGKIILPQVGAIAVWGLTFSALKDVLRAELSQYMQDFQMNITMRKLRTIRVYVVGKARIPGSYSLSSLSTMINALFAAGGPNKNGTMRNIQLIRNGQAVKTLDLYDFLLKGDKSPDERLQPGDTIFIPVIGEVVGIAGNVKEAAIYEMKDRLTVGELIKLAGGVPPTGYLQRVQVERVSAHEERIIVDLNLSPAFPEKAAAQLSAILQDRDMVKIYPIAAHIQNVVVLGGHVLRPGDYEFKEGMRLSDLLTSYDDLLPEPHLDYAEILRLEEPDFHQRIIPFNLREVLKRNPEHDLKLRRFDKIKVYSKWFFEDRYEVSIKGEVRRPKKFPLLEDMGVSDLVQKAGGLTKEAYLTKAEIFRLTPDREIETIAFDLGRALAGDPEADILLQDEDRVVVHNIWETKWKETVHITGQVNKPGEYRLTQSMGVSDLIFRAGSLKDSAYLREAELTRMLIDQEGITTRQLEIDLGKALRNNPKHNILLQKYDTLNVRIIPDWKESRVAGFKGEVRFPGTYNIGKEERVSSLLRRAGGYTDEAYLRGAIFTRKSVKALQRKRLDELVRKQELEIRAISPHIMGGTLSKDDLEAAQQTLAAQKELLRKLKAAEVTGRVVVKLAPLDEFTGSEYDIKLEDGDELSIPLRPDTVGVLGEVYNTTSILYREGKPLSYYLNKVGGPTKEADDDEIYLVRADGSVISRSQESGLRISWDAENNRWVSGSFMSTTLEPGDIILVPRELEKIQWLKTASELTQILFHAAIAAGIVIAVF